MPEDVKENQPSAPSLPDVARKWLEIRDAIHQATAQGVGRWISGPGNPKRILNPFLGLGGPGPGQTYGPGRLRGVGAMGGRLRITENEGSAPMISLREVARQNPLIQKGTIKVEDLPPGVSGQISYRDPLRPAITIAPVVSPYTDPGATAVHEIAGHGGHGPVGWRAKDEVEHERDIRPQAEGTAEGAVKGLYGDLAPPSAYDQIYGDQEHYQRAKALGESLAQHIGKTGKVPPWQVVQNVIFGRPPATAEPKPETPVAQETPKNQVQLSSPVGLRAFGLRPKKIEAPGPAGGSSPADLKKKAFGIKPPTAFESWEKMLAGMSF